MAANRYANSDIINQTMMSLKHDYYGQIAQVGASLIVNASVAARADWIVRNDLSPTFAEDVRALRYLGVGAGVVLGFEDLQEGWGSGPFEFGREAVGFIAGNGVDLIFGFGEAAGSALTGGLGVPAAIAFEATLGTASSFLAEEGAQFAYSQLLGLMGIRSSEENLELASTRLVERMVLQQALEGVAAQDALEVALVKIAMQRAIEQVAYIAGILVTP